MPRFPLIPLLLCLVMDAGCQHDLTSGNPGDNRFRKVLSCRLPNREAIAKVLPADVHLDTVTECGYGGTPKITVEDELVRVKAHLGEDGKLYDTKGKPIQFFWLTGCWGNPPGNYREILDEQNRCLEELQKTHTVITLTCNPSGIPIP
jgi:hypothetical protein